MKKVVALEDGLSGALRSALEKEGYTVVKPGFAGNVDATVISGMDGNVMGMQDRENNSVVIDASGKTAQQVLNDLRARL
ncbi:MAG: YkuS family protein [Firmicutes bacterium]|nr:YkuS family protein [Bacillota bacterium]